MCKGMFCYSQILNYISIRMLKPEINGFNFFFSILFKNVHTKNRNSKQNLRVYMLLFALQCDITFPHCTCKYQINRFSLYKLFFIEMNHCIKYKNVQFKNNKITIIIKKSLQFLHLIDIMTFLH